MARRRTLEERAARVTELIKGRDLTQLPKKTLVEISRLQKALGLDRDFLSYSTRSRQRYIQAAKQGRTAAQQRQVERQVRRQRESTKLPRAAASIKGDHRWKRVTSLVRELKTEGMNVRKGDNTYTDDLDYDDLYSDESLEAHIRVYGYPYVVGRLEHQYAAIRQYNTSGGKARSLGRDDMRKQFGTLARRDFAASERSGYTTDERWFWYHASGSWMDSPSDGSPKLIGGK